MSQVPYYVQGQLREGPAAVFPRENWPFNQTVGVA